MYEHTNRALRDLSKRETQSAWEASYFDDAPPIRSREYREQALKALADGEPAEALVFAVLAVSLAIVNT